MQAAVGSTSHAGNNTKNQNDTFYSILFEYILLTSISFYDVCHLLFP